MPAYFSCQRIAQWYKRPAARSRPHHARSPTAGGGERHRRIVMRRWPWSLAVLTAVLLHRTADGQVTVEPGWPVTTAYSVSPSATIAQLDPSTPQWEIVIASQDQHVYCCRHDGTLLPGWPQFIGNTLSPDQYAIINASPAVADL